MGKKPLRTVAELAEAGIVAPESVPALERVAARYAVALTPAMAELIDAADPTDPIARQFVPDARELETRPEERTDPIGDRAFSPVKGVVHRHPDRVLLKPLHVCPVYCRFCFRREMIGPAGEGSPTEAEFDAAIAYIRAHAEIREVILTGGDPLMLSARRIAAVGRALAGVDHVRIVRWHTRVPLVDPARVTPEVVAALRAPRVATWIAVHANHPREFTEPGREALARLADAGIPLVSQTVLLRGVNDDAATLEALMRAFVENRVKPYYLHHADLAPGTAHFRTTVAEGQALMRRLRQRLSGLGMPTYVLDIPGGAGKVPVGPAYMGESKGCDGEAVVFDLAGRVHGYPPGAVAEEESQASPAASASGRSRKKDVPRPA
jgi:lysine 2,3-aminomutase